MELHELHVPQFDTGPVGHGVSVAGRHQRIRRFAINLTGTAGAQDGLLGPHQGQAVLVVVDQRTAADTVVSQQVERERVLANVDIPQPAGPADHGPHDFPAGGVTHGVRDPTATVPPLTPQIQFARLHIEVGSPANQFLDAVGSFAHDHGDDVRIAQFSAGRQGVGHVRIERVVGIQDARNAALCITAGGLVDAVLGKHQHRQPGIDGNGGPQTGQARADDQDVCEEVGNLLRVKRHQIPMWFMIHGLCAPPSPGPRASPFL